MALKFKSKPIRITREEAKGLVRQAIAYYKNNKEDGSIFRVYLEYEVNNPRKNRIIVDKERDRRHIPDEIFRNGLVYLPTSEEYNNSKNKPTQKNLEDLIYYKGNQQLSQLYKIGIKHELMNNYLHPWAINGIDQPDIPTRVVFKSSENDEEDVIYQGALSDDIFVDLSQWFDELQEMEELKDVSAQVIGDNDIRNEIADGNRKFRIAILGEVGEVFVKVGYNKFGNEINFENYIK